MLREPEIDTNASILACLRRVPRRFFGYGYLQESHRRTIGEATSGECISTTERPIGVGFVPLGLVGGILNFDFLR